jgi:hypothetical protein
VPSTGKLYHHKMRLRNLTPDSDIDEMMEYLEKRHPLYFMNKKFSKVQVRDLVQRLKFRMVAKAKVTASASAASTAASTKPMSKAAQLKAISQAAATAADDIGSQQRVKSKPKGIGIGIFD